MQHLLSLLSYFCSLCLWNTEPWHWCVVIEHSDLSNDVSNKSCTRTAPQALPVLHLSDFMQVMPRTWSRQNIIWTRWAVLSTCNARGWEEEHSSTKVFAGGVFSWIHIPWKTNLIFVETILPTKESRTACIWRGIFINWTKWDFHLQQECRWHLL